MIAGDEFTYKGKVLVARPNLVQILTQGYSCEGCYFEKTADPFECMGLDCGGTLEQTPADEQIILVLKESQS